MGQSWVEITDLVERKDSLTFKANFLNQALDLPATGKYNATNAMIASMLASTRRSFSEQIRQAFQNLNWHVSVPEWKKAANGADILSDVYNANHCYEADFRDFSAIPAMYGGKKNCGLWTKDTSKLLRSGARKTN